MANDAKCLKCGAPLTPDARDGVCPKCLLGQALVGNGAGSAWGASAAARDNGSAPPVEPGRECPWAEEPFLPAQPPPLLHFGNYDLLEEIGRGGMGVVYKARQRSLNRIVALKMILHGQFASKEEVLRFRAEAEAAANLRHPNIVAIYETGEHDGQHYFSMDYVAGRTLARLVREEGPLTAKRAARYAQLIAAAIHYAHQHNTLHRDLKPSNVLIDAEDQPRVTDFGLAKRLRGDWGVTLTGQVLGSPSFMPPEQAAGKTKHLTAAADIYSLGALLYHLLTGRPPFQAQTIEEVLVQLRETEPVALHLLNPSVPRDLETICLKCLEKDPQRRYASAEALAEDLAHWTAGEPIRARRVRAAERFWRWCRRKPVLAALGGAVTLLVLTVAVGSPVVAWHIAKARDAARRAEQRALESLSRYQLQKAEHLFQTDQSGAALAYLARVLHREPFNRVAVERLLSALSGRGFVLPLTEPLLRKTRGRLALFSQDDRQILTAPPDGGVEFWDTLTGAAKGLLLRTPDRPFSVDFSPDGQRLATGGTGTVLVWDLRTGMPRPLALNHPYPIICLRFSPDGTCLATGSEDGAARVWDVQTGQPVTDPLRHQRQVRSLAFSPDGQWLATASRDSTARIWNARTGQPHTDPLPHDDWVVMVEFSPDGARLVTSAADHAAKIWDAHTGQLLAVLRHRNVLHSARFSPEGQKIVTSSEDGTAVIWDARTGQPVGQPLRHGSWVLDARFCPDGLRIVTASDDNTARLWDAESGAPLSEPLRHTRNVLSAQFSHNGRFLLCTVKDGTVWIWNALPTQVHPLRLAKSGGVRAARFCPLGQWIAGAGTADQPRLWSAQNGQLQTAPANPDAATCFVGFSRDGQWIATASSNHTARVWNVRTGQPVTGPLLHDAAVLSVEFSPDGQRVVTASADRTARIWDARSGQPISAALRHERPVHYAQFSPDGEKVLTASQDQTAQVWKASDGQRLFQLQHAHWVYWAEFSPDGQRIVTSSADRTAQVWDARTGQPLGLAMAHDHDVFRAHFSPDGRRIITVSIDRTARLWDGQTGQALTEPLRHQGIVWSARFCPEGRRVVTGSEDRTARIWDTASGLPLAEPFYAGSEVVAVDFAPDGRAVLVAAGPGGAEVGEVPAVPVPAPAWLAELAESVGGKRLNAQDMLEPVPPSELFRLKRELIRRPQTDPYVRWARWFLADPTTSTIAPHSPVTVPEYVRQQTEEGSVASLRQAVRLSPTNALALVRLARQVLAQEETPNRRHAAAAEWYSRRAVALAPTDSEVLSIRSEIRQRLEELERR